MVNRTLSAILLVGILTACNANTATPTASTSPRPSTSATSSMSPQTAPKTTTATAPEARAPMPDPVPSGTRIILANSQFGPILYDDSGQAIYVFDVEDTATPQCYEECAAAWPPVLTIGLPIAAPGINQVMLATTARADGTVQVTYNNHPLYFYANEGKYDVRCHDVFLNGGNWYVVLAEGNPAPA